MRWVKEFKIKHIIKVLWSCCRTESGAIGNKMRPDTMPRPSGETADQKLPFPKIHLLLLTRKSPHPIGYIAYLPFESFFPFVLYFAVVSQVSVGAAFWIHKGSFYSSHLKNNFLCHLFGLLFWGRWFRPQPELDGPSLLRQSAPQLINVSFQKKASSLQSKPRQSLAELNEEHSINVANTFHVINHTEPCWLCIQRCVFVY